MVQFGRSVLGHAEAALRREWLVTNGIGGYAMGSLLANAPTRKYHGLLIAALEPPLGRVALVGGLSVFAEYDDAVYELSAFEWADGTFADGYRFAQGWTHEFGIPTFTFACADSLVQQRIWMEHGQNTTYVHFTHHRGRQELNLRLKPLVTERDHHATTVDSAWQPTITPITAGAAVALQSGHSLNLYCQGGTWQADGRTWIDDLRYRSEDARGHDAFARLLCAGEFSIKVQPGESCTLVVSTESTVDLDGAAALAREQRRTQSLLAAADVTPDDKIAPLILAADQFLVRRDVRLPDQTTHQGISIIAGYPWFGDWGRDTMIALPGLLISTGRTELAATTLRTWSHFVSQGMLPNRFPDAGEAEYNTVDATLWFIQAIRATVHASRDRSLIADLYPVLVEVIRWHRQGTRYGIRVDDDGLLTAGQPDVQLTWMDVKYKDWVVTPRHGKAVEINALWYSALRTLAEFATDQGLLADAAQFTDEANQVQTAFERFWSDDHGYLFDVIDGPDGDDPALRPNQLLALSVAHPLITGDRAKAILAICSRWLVIDTGVRSLAPYDPAYLGLYGGDLKARDSAYHQGTAWGWLLGPFVTAYAHEFGDQAARQWLTPMLDHLRDAGIGSISEIFSGDEPSAPEGCPWQAWSVAEFLRIWRRIV